MRALFTSVPASSHLHPLVPIALAARDAGHDVGFAVCAARCPALARLGFAAHPAGADEGDPAVAHLLAEGMALNGLEPIWTITNVFAGLFADRMIPDLRTVVERWRPDVIVCDVTEYASWVVAEQYRVPRAVVPFGIDVSVDLLAQMGAGPALEALRRRAGLAPEPWLDTRRAQPCLLFAPPGYQIPGVPLGANVHLFRPAVFDQSGEETLPAWVHDLGDRPLVYATLGTAYNETAGILEATVEAARDLDVDLVVTVGRNRDPASLGATPANVRVERYIPQSLLLPHCDAVISHGGYSTVMATLCNGLPAVLTPIGADQPMHAGRCGDLGVAVVVEPGAVSPESMRTAIRQILDDPGYGARARGLRDEMAGLPGVEAAVQLLERLAAGG